MIQGTITALCDPTRREIIKLLKKGERSSGEIAERFDVSAPAISRHLALLREAELVSVTRRGKFVIYALRTEKMEDLREWLGDIIRD